MSNEKKCPHCQAPIQENASFCFHCMKSLDSKTVIVKEKKKFPVLWVVSASVLLVAVLLFTLYFLSEMKGRNKNDMYIGGSDIIQNTDKDKYTSSQKNSGTGNQNTQYKQNTNEEQNKVSSESDDGSFWDFLFGKKSESSSGDTGVVTSSHSDSSSDDAGTVIPAPYDNSSKNSGGSSSQATPVDSSKPETHSHNYSVSITKTATCGKDGVKTYTCSCGDGYTQTIPATGNHIWGEMSQIIHHDEVGHMENVQESRKVTKYQCAKCKQKFSTIEEYYSHFDSTHKPSYEGDLEMMLREWYTMVSDYEYYYVQKYVVDKAAYDEKVITGYKCSVCGAIK